MTVFTMRLVDRLSLGFQMGALVALLGLLLVGAVAYGAGYAGTRAVAELTGQRLVGVAASAAYQLDRDMFERRSNIAAVARVRQAALAAAGDPDSFRLLVSELRNGFPHYVWLGLIDRSGTVVAGSDGALEGSSMAGEPWFEETSGTVTVGRLRYAGAGNGQYRSTSTMRYIPISAPVRGPDGRPAGMVATHLSWAWAEELRQRALQLEDLLNGIELTFLDPAGEHLMGPRLDPGDLAALLERRDRGLLVSGWIERGGGEDGMLYGFAEGDGYRAFAGLGWLVVARQPSTAAFAELSRVQQAIASIGILGALVGCLAAGLLAHRLTRPLRSLAVEARALARGQEGRLSRSYGSAELGELSLALRALLRRLGGADRALRQTRRGVASAQAERDRYRELATIDPLSGLLNRRALFEAATPAFAALRECRRPLSVATFDIDHFKRVNDTFGHAAGDAVIRQLSALAREQSREGDLVARFGGEEFLVVLPGASLDEAVGYAERVRRAVEATPVVHDQTRVRVTVSAGCSTVLAVDGDLQNAIDRADAALYEAKAAGRNQVRRATARIKQVA